MNGFENTFYPILGILFLKCLNLSLHLESFLIDFLKNFFSNRFLNFDFLIFKIELLKFLIF